MGHKGKLDFIILQFVTIIEKGEGLKMSKRAGVYVTMDELLEAAIKLSQELRSSYIEIRALASSSFIQDDRFRKSDFYKHHYLPLRTDPENLKKEFNVYYFLVCVPGN